VDPPEPDAPPLDVVPPVVGAPPVEVTPPVDVAPPVVAAPPVEAAPPLAVAPPVDPVPEGAEPPVDIAPPAVAIPPLAAPPEPEMGAVPAEPLLPAEPPDGLLSVPLLHAATANASAVEEDRSQVGIGLEYMMVRSHGLCVASCARPITGFSSWRPKLAFLPGRHTVPLPAFGPRCNVFSSWNRSGLINF
jgi:hypothetical protein